MIRLNNVRKRFGDKDALKGITLTIEKGETIAIIGGSGSGKSTLLRLMIGLDRPTSGEIYIGDENIAAMSENALDRVRLRMGMVFQYSALFDSMTVGLREHTTKTDEEIVRIVAEKLALVGLPDAAALMPQELSGGMKKRVGLARAIATDPEIIFYDEPSSGLDPIMTAKIDELIIDMQRQLDVTSVVVTHDMASASRIADRIAMIYDGELIAVDTAERFQDIKDERVQAFFRTLHQRREAGA